MYLTLSLSRVQYVICFYKYIDILGDLYGSTFAIILFIKKFRILFVIGLIWFLGFFRESVMAPIW